MDGGALLISEERGRGLLDELLEAALQGAVAGTHDDDVAVLVGEDLGLDVAGLVEVALDEALAAAEGGGGLAGSGLEELGDLVALVGDLHAASAAAEGGLDGDGQAVLVGEGLDLGGILNRVRGAWSHGGIGTLRDVAGRHLVAEIGDGLRGGANPDEAGVEDGLGELGVLGEEAVARVDGVGAGLRGGVEDLGNVEVRLGRGLTAQGEGLVGERDERGVRVRLGVDGDRGNSSVTCGTDDAHGDLTAVGDEHLGDLLGFNSHGLFKTFLVCLCSDYYRTQKHERSVRFLEI